MTPFEAVIAALIAVALLIALETIGAAVVRAVMAMAD